MSTLDQCPSTKNTIDIPKELPELGKVSGRKYWRSIEEYSATPEFKELIEREFPVDASIMDDTSRRSFIKIMGASMALAGAATIPGCRRPDRKILPYAREVPENVIPGRPLFFATAMALPNGGMEGLLIETHAGRPTKIEGNPLHPNNQGKTSPYAQASILDLYDPDRLKFPFYNNPVRGRLAATWDDFDLWANEHFAKFDDTKGVGLAFIIDKQSSLIREYMRIQILKRWPRAAFVAWDPAESHGESNGSKAILGQSHWARYNLSKAKRILSIGEGQIDQGPEALSLARQLAASRKLLNHGDEMSRLYAVESKPSSIGVMADHRFRVAPSQLHNFTIALAKAVLLKTASSGHLLPDVEVVGITQSEIQAIADDLFENRRHAVVLPSQDLSAESWALCQVINDTLKATDEDIVEFFPMVASNPMSSGQSLRRLTAALNNGSVDTLVCLGTNPIFDTPGSMDFEQAFKKAKHTITLSTNASETADASTWSLNGTHYLESWDAIYGIDGQISIAQPMIAPLYAPARSQIEFLAGVLNAGSEHPDPAALEGYSVVQSSLREYLKLGPDQIGKVWKASLHNGIVANTARPATNPDFNTERLIRNIKDNGSNDAPAQSHLDVQFYTDRYNIGQSANNGWLQELPEFGTSVVWDNPLLLSPSTAKALGILPLHTSQDEFNPYTKAQMPQAQLVNITLDDRTMTMPAWILPGMADNTVAIKLGYGRTNAGRVGNQVGFNSYDIKTITGMLTAGATITKAKGTYTIASTQNHWSMEGRDTIVRAIDKKWFDKHAAAGIKAVPDQIYGGFSPDAVSHLNVAEQLGELAHTPPLISAYDNPQSGSKAGAAAGSVFSKNPQWGMSIDMNACTGCATCTVACQSENNIPVVGKSEVAKGREMAWIRIDRYFTGDDLNSPDEIFNQPIACVHCENAPCETVCPVNATTHGKEGTNDIAYNRCIGTRYCANNCPYKVRRFNFFDYAPSKFNGGLNPNYTSRAAADKFEKTVGQDRTFNQNLIPPRLRKKLDEISKMKFNPDVTVRSRGVIEKCSYCIQRVNAARQDVKIQGIWTEKDQVGPIPDGFFQVACQQACPTDAIAFGDILDPHSRVAKERDSHRTYALLGYLNTRPRTTHMMRVRNPNPAIHVFDKHDPLDHGGGHETDHGSDSHEPAADTQGEQHSAVFTDSVKQYLDQGYSLSLKVIS